MSHYNITGQLAGNNTNIVDLVSFVDTASNNIYIGGFLIAVFLVVAVVLSRSSQNVLGSLAWASWVMFLVSGLLFFAQLATFTFPMFFLVVAGVSVALLYLNQSS